MFHRRHLNWLKDTISTDPHISIHQRDFILAVLYMHLKDTKNFNRKKWVGHKDEIFKEIIENDTSHTYESAVTKPN